MEHLLLDYLSKYTLLDPDERKVMVELDVFRQYKKGKLLLKEGELSTNVYFVLKGCIRSYYVIDGGEKTTAFYTEGESFSPLCSFYKQPSEYYVSCVEDCILVVANSEMEELIYQKFPRFDKLCRILSAELLAKNKTVFDEFKISSPETRYLQLQQTRPDLLQRVPLYQLASFLGISPQSLSRMRSRLVGTVKLRSRGRIMQ